jgi:hypothetical protein
MTPEQIQGWATLIAAVAAAVVSVIAALKGQQAHAEAKAVREALQALPPGTAPATPPGVSLSDVWTYAETISEVLFVVKGVQNLQPHESVPIPKTVLDLPHGERIELAPTTATRTR